MSLGHLENGLNRREYFLDQVCMLKLIKEGRLRPKPVHRTKIHVANLLKQLRLSWFPKTLPRYSVCTYHMTYIKYDILIKTDNSVFPSKAPSSDCRNSLAVFASHSLSEPPSFSRGKGQKSIRRKIHYCANT